ncbi:MAG: flagellar filament capping protein FliD, partial [Clostridia bacterium]|nr:flagellar filament capping protein FliD [Clostridia bacterium]
MAITGLGGIGGIFSGLDTDTLVRQLMSIERRPAVLMENRRHLYELRKELWSEVNGALLALRAKAEAFLDPYAVNRKKVSSSDETAVVARVGDHGQALVGRYDISVTRLATAHKVWGTAMGAGWTYGGSAAETFQVSDGTVTVSVTVNPGDDLLDIARSINDARDGSGRKADVQATVIGDVLYLQRGMTGAGNVMTFTDSTNGILKTLGILNATGSIANQSVPQDAQFSVNGLSFVRSQNTGLTDVIAGLSIDLRKEGVAAALTVEQDVQAGVDAIRAFVDQYNAVIDLVNTRLSEKPEPNAVTDTALRKGLLRGDTTLVNIKSRLRTTMTQNYGSLSLYKDLSQIGIRTDSADFGKSGKLVVDEAKLREA